MDDLFSVIFIISVVLYMLSQREIDKLAALCAEKGASEEDIAHCRVKRKWRHTANIQLLLIVFVVGRHKKEEKDESIY